MSRRPFATAVLLLTIGLGLCPPPARADPRGETILVSIPDGFKVGYEATKAGLIMREFVRADETVDDWSRMITLQIFQGKANQNPDGFARGLADRWRSGCAGGTALNFHSGVENGFPVALWIYECPLNPATRKPETMYLKAISGADSFYVVQYAFRQETNKALTGEAVGYLRKIGACDTRRVDRRCPAGM